MGAYATNLEFPVGSHARETVQYNLKRKISSFVWETLNVQVLFSDCCQAKVFCCIELLLSWKSTQLLFCCPLFLQVSAQPQKTSPTRLRTCGQSAARTLEGRTLWLVQMGRSQATVGECHIPARLAKPSVLCLSGLNSIRQSYQSLSLLQLPPS